MRRRARGKKTPVYVLVLLRCASMVNHRRCADSEQRYSLFSFVSPTARELLACFRMRDWRWGYIVSNMLLLPWYQCTVVCLWKKSLSKSQWAKLDSEKPPIRQKYSLAARYVGKQSSYGLPRSKTPNNSLCDAVVNRWKMLLGYHMYSCCGATRCVAPG